MAFTPAGNAARYTPVATIPVPGAASAAPNPAYSGVFIPEIWSSKLVEKFYDATVLAAIANTDYEGEIQKYGDTINIRQRPDVTINDYSPDMRQDSSNCIPDPPGSCDFIGNYFDVNPDTSPEFDNIYAGTHLLHPSGRDAQDACGPKQGAQAPGVRRMSWSLSRAGLEPEYLAVTSLSGGGGGGGGRDDCLGPH